MSSSRATHPTWFRATPTVHPINSFMISRPGTPRGYRWHRVEQKPRTGEPINLAINGSGRYVAFASDARNLVHGDDNSASDVFVHDRGTALGTGGLAASGRLKVGNRSGLAASGVITRLDGVADVG